MHYRITLFLASLLALAGGVAAAETVAPKLKSNPGAKPYPDSTLLTQCTIDPAVLSFPPEPKRVGDCWPMTWADDGALYTYFNDGVGFKPEMASTSMHPAKVLGTPPDLQGVDIESDATGISTGGGGKGRKVSGLLALPDPAGSGAGLLAAWVRNVSPAGGASLMVSRDRGAHWRWAWGDPSADPKAIIPELGYPTWVQAGQNNAAAPDDYLYFYSQDAPKAYLLADGALLGRVPGASLLDRTRYEYFCGEPGRPAWTGEIAQRKPAFRAPGQCYRLSVTYNPVLKRYFMLTANGDHAMTRYAGTHNLGIYEAPQPWGPWATVYWSDAFQPEWNVFHPQMVPKWVAPDGLSFYLLYSCYNQGPYKMNLQKVTLKK